MTGESNDYGDFVDLLVNKPLYSSIKRPNHKHIISSRSSSPSIAIPTEDYEKLLKLPSIELHCSSDKCGGIRVFESPSPQPRFAPKNSDEIILYMCRNCNRSFKTFWLQFSLSDDHLEVKKLGEYPPFGLHIPSKLITILRESRDLFIKGNRCESQGLGIGAFVYYRRVIENQKNKIFDKLIEVSEKIAAPTEFIDSLKEAQKQVLFSKSIEQIKPMFPDVLKINGYNPLTLLNNALSQGVHEMSDEECLGTAQQIRVVLSRFAESLNFALKDDKELTDAVTKLLTLKSPTNKPEKKDTENDTK